MAVRRENILSLQIKHTFPEDVTGEGTESTCAFSRTFKTDDGSEYLLAQRIDYAKNALYLDVLDCRQDHSESSSSKEIVPLDESIPNKDSKSRYILDPCLSGDDTKVLIHVGSYVDPSKMASKCVYLCPVGFPNLLGEPVLLCGGDESFKVTSYSFTADNKFALVAGKNSETNFIDVFNSQDGEYLCRLSTPFAYSTECPIPSLFFMPLGIHCDTESLANPEVPNSIACIDNNWQVFWIDSDADSSKLTMRQGENIIAENPDKDLMDHIDADNIPPFIVTSRRGNYAAMLVRATSDGKEALQLISFNISLSSNSPKIDGVRIVDKVSVQDIKSELCYKAAGKFKRPHKILASFSDDEGGEVILVTNMNKAENGNEVGITFVNDSTSRPTFQTFATLGNEDTEGSWIAGGIMKSRTILVTAHVTKGQSHGQFQLKSWSLPTIQTAEDPSKQVFEKISEISLRDVPQKPNDLRADIKLSKSKDFISVSATNAGITVVKFGDSS